MPSAIFMVDVTKLLQKARDAPDQAIIDVIFSHLYADLHRMAAALQT